MLLLIKPGNKKTTCFIVQACDDGLRGSHSFAFCCVLQLVPQLFFPLLIESKAPLEELPPILPSRSPLVLLHFDPSV